MVKEIRIGGFGGEEDGLTGSRAYVGTLPAEERALRRRVADGQPQSSGICEAGSPSGTGLADFGRSAPRRIGGDSATPEPGWPVA